MLKALIIVPKCIMLELEETMTNPELPGTKDNFHPCQNCSVCREKIIGKKYNKNELKKFLFRIFSESIERGEIEGKQTAKVIVNAIQKQEDNCKNTFMSKIAKTNSNVRGLCNIRMFIILVVILIMPRTNAYTLLHPCK